MSKRFENIVRPFETPRIGPPQRIFQPYQQSNETVEMTFGRNGSGKIMNGSFSYTQTFYLDERWVEVPF